MKLWKLLMRVSVNMQIYLRSNSFCIEVESKSINVFTAFKRCRILPTIIPNIEIFQDPAPSVINYRIIHTQDSANSITTNNNTFHIHEAWDDNDIPGYIVFFIYKLFDHLYLTKNYISFHSSAISKNNKSILLVGSAGSGKTGTMLHMVLKKGFQFLSNNRTVVDAIDSTVIAGTNHISIRKEDIFRYQDLIQSDALYTTVTGFQILEQHELGIKQTAQFPQHLSGIVIIRITNDVSKFQIINKEIAIYKLYENISRTQWGEGLLFAGEVIGPILDTAETAQKRLNLLKLLLKDQRCYEINGSVEFIEQNIEHVLALDHD